MRASTSLMASAVRDRDQPLEGAPRGAGVDRLRRPRDALAKGCDLLGDDERRGGVEHGDVAVGRGQALERGPQLLGVMLRVAALEVLRLGPRDPDLLRRDGELA